MEGSSGGMVVTNQRTKIQGIRIGNPFTLKVGQVFTGFGVGCGIGIGVGRPINLGAIPVLNQVMSATRGATDAFSGVSQHVNITLKKVGAKNIEAGIGCGVGIGHGFGVGLALRSGVLQQIQLCFAQTMTKMMEKVGIPPNLPIGLFPSSLRGGMSMINSPSNEYPIGSITQLQTRLPEQASSNLPGFGNKSIGSSSENFMSESTSNNTPFASRTEQVINSFLQSPILKGDESKQNVTGRLRSENSMLHMVLKHQQVIEKLKEESEKLRQILVEELKVAPEKLQASNSIKNKSPCKDCFECRRKHRKSRLVPSRLSLFLYSCLVCFGS